MIWNTSVPFYSNLIKTAKATAAKENVDSSDIQSGNGDLATQIAVVQQFITQQVDMILIAPSDPEGDRARHPSGQRRRISPSWPSTPWPTPAPARRSSPMSASTITYSASSQGELLAEAIGEKGKVAYILGKLGTSAQLHRKAGLDGHAEETSRHQDRRPQAADWDNAKALAITQDYLSKYPKGAIDGDHRPGPRGRQRREFRRRQRPRRRQVHHGRLSRRRADAIIKGTVLGTVDQDPYPQGKYAIEDAVKWLDGKKSEVPTPDHFLDLPIITKKNAEATPAAWGG